MSQRSRVLVAAIAALLLVLPAIASADEHEEVDGRAHVSWVEGVVDENGQLWFKVGFYLPWDETPPSDVYSLFFSLTLVVTDAGGETTKTVGWETHDGVEAFLGEEGTQAFILDNGCVLVATGIRPEGPYEAKITANFASWQDESTTDPVDGSEGMGTSSQFVDEGDPMTFFGTPVFNLTTGQPVDGSATGGDPNPTTSSTNATSDTLDSDSSPPDTGSDGDTGSSGIDAGFLFGLVALFTLLFLFWWYGIRPKRYAYRADREVGLDIVEDEPEATDDEPLDLEAAPVEGGVPLVIEEPDASFEDPCWEQSRRLDDAQARLRDLDTEQGETDPSHEQTHKALDQAIDQARENVEAAQRALDECIKAHQGSLTRDGGDRATAGLEPSQPAVSPEEPTEFSKDCKEEEAAYAAAVAATDAAKERRDAAEAAWLKADDAGKAEALAERDASVEAQDAAIDAENDARRALDACRRVSVDDTDDEVEVGGIGSPSGEDDPDGDCAEGTEEWRYESQSQRFTVLKGEVRVRISSAPVTWGAWQRENGSATTVSGEALLELDEGQMTELLTPLDPNRRALTSFSIPTERIRVRCERLYRCVEGQWVPTEHMRKDPRTFESPDEHFGSREVSTVDNIVEVLEAMKARLVELRQNLEDAKAFECEA